MKGFNFNLLDEPSEHGFMPNMVCYILDHNHEGPRPMVLICPGGGYWCYAEHQEGERTAMAYLAAGYNAALVRTVFVRINFRMHFMTLQRQFAFVANMQKSGITS